MRILYKASLVFLLTDMYSKIPIRHASILCNGKQNPYTKKASGEYVFSNLYPGKYRIDIICKGFADTRLDLDVRANETRTVTMNLPYSSDNDLVLKLPRFEIIVKSGGKLVKDKDVRVRLENNLNFLKVIEPIRANTNSVSLNIEKSSSLTLQRYAYSISGGEKQFYIYAYDPMTSQYLTEELIDMNLLPGGMLYPIWDLKTDMNGKVILPILKQFMKEEPIQLEVSADGKHGFINTRMPNENIGEKVIYIDIDLAEPMPPPPPLPQPVTLEDPKKTSDKKSKSKDRNGDKSKDEDDEESIEDSIDDTEDTEGEEYDNEVGKKDTSGEKQDDKEETSDVPAKKDEDEEINFDVPAEKNEDEEVSFDAPAEKNEDEGVNFDAPAEKNGKEATGNKSDSSKSNDGNKSDTTESEEAENIEDSIHETKDK